MGDLAGRGSSDRSDQAWRRHLSTAGVVIECPGVEHRAGSIDGWLDSPPQQVGDGAPVLSIRGWEVVYSLAVKVAQALPGRCPARRRRVFGQRRLAFARSSDLLLRRGGRST